MRRFNRLLMAAAALTCLGTAPAFADGPPDPYWAPGFNINVIGGGSTFPSIVYRQLLDCLFHPMGYTDSGYHYYQIDYNYFSDRSSSYAYYVLAYHFSDPKLNYPGPLAINTYCPSYPFGTSSDGFHYFYYAPTGSSNGKLAFKANDNLKLSASISSSVSDAYGDHINLGTIPTTIPYTSNELPRYPYLQTEGYHFSGSEDPWNLADQNDWNAAGGPASKYGNVIQLPAVAGAVAIIGRAVNLTRQAMCGIFSGHITKWSNPILTAHNNLAAPNDQITVVHRFDGSGTNFLLTNALQEQCKAITGPNNETDPTIVSYAFPWGDHSVCPAGPRGASQVNWPDQFPSICGGTNNNPVPPGSVFTYPIDPSTGRGIPGSQALVDMVRNTFGAIGYASSVVAPSWCKHDGYLYCPNFYNHNFYYYMDVAYLQNEWDVSTNLSGTPTFVAPTIAATKVALSSVTPVFDDTTRGNPLAWSLQGVLPNPVLPGAYPIAGFSWILMYQCYNSRANMPVQLAGFVFGLYPGTGAPPTPGSQAIIESNGFAQVPDVWLTEVYKLLQNPSLAPGNTWDTTPGNPCAGKIGAR